MFWEQELPITSMPNAAVAVCSELCSTRLESVRAAQVSPF